MSIRKRITTTFDIDTDMVPGTFHEAKDFLKSTYFLPRLWEQYNGEMVSSKIEDLSAYWPLWRHTCEPQNESAARERLSSFGAELDPHTLSVMNGQWVSFMFKADEHVVDRAIDAGDLGDITRVDEEDPSAWGAIMQTIKKGILCDTDGIPDTVKRAIRSLYSTKTPFVVVYLDIDDLSELEARHGERFVDRFKRDCWLRIQESIRTTDVIAPYAKRDPGGSDELLIVLKGLQPDQGASTVDSIRNRVSWAYKGLCPQNPAPSPPTSSAGWIYVDPEKWTPTVSTIVKAVRAAEDAAKLAGKDRSHAVVLEEDWYVIDANDNRRKLWRPTTSGIIAGLESKKA